MNLFELAPIFTIRRDRPSEHVLIGVAFRFVDADRNKKTDAVEIGRYPSRPALFHRRLGFVARLDPERAFDDLPQPADSVIPAAFFCPSVSPSVTK